MSDVVKVTRADRVAWVTLNRPEKLNALNRPMWTALGEVMRDLSADEELGCVVLRGAGTAAFSPGHDIAEFETGMASLDDALAYAALIRATYEAVRACRHPTIAMIHGICTGGGLELALVCDLRIAGASARCGLPISRIGVALSYPLLEALIDVVGRPVALEMLLEARVFEAREAREKGLLTRVVEDDRLEAEVRASAGRILDGAPLVNRWHKEYALRLRDPRPVSEAELTASYACFGTEDFRIGTRAFLEKKKPAFKGR